MHVKEINIQWWYLLTVIGWFFNIIECVYGFSLDDSRACTWEDLDRCTYSSSKVILNPVHWDLPDTFIWCKFVQTRKDCLLNLDCDKSGVNETPFNFTTLVKNQLRTHFIYDRLGFCNEHNNGFDANNLHACHLTSIRRNCLLKAAAYIKSPTAVACQGVLKILDCIEQSQQQCGMENIPSAITTNIYRMHSEGHCQYIAFPEFESLAEEWRRQHPDGFCSDCI